VFPSNPCAFIGFQGVHSPHFLCVRTVHSPSLDCCTCHTLATNKDILLVSAQDHSQGDIVGPTVRTPTTNGLRSSWDLLPGGSPDMLAGLSPSIETNRFPNLDTKVTDCHIQDILPIIKEKQSLFRTPSPPLLESTALFFYKLE